VLLWFLPFAEVVAYPIRIFVTILHEAAHAVMAWATGGSVSSIRVSSDGAGMTVTQGGSLLVISSAGYIGTMAYGAGLLLLCRKPQQARVALAITALFIGAISLGLVRPVGSSGFLLGFGLSIAGVGIAIFTSPRRAQFLTGFLGVESCLNALFDLKALVYLSTGTDVKTDARNLQELTHIPAVVWAILWTLVALALLFLALRRVQLTWR
jgi:hypothetical protein